MPLAVADPSWDVGRHCGLCLTWMEKGGKRREWWMGGWTLVVVGMKRGKMKGEEGNKLMKVKRRVGKAKKRNGKSEL